MWVWKASSLPSDLIPDSAHFLRLLFQHVTSSVAQQGWRSGEEEKSWLSCLEGLQAHHYLKYSSWTPIMFKTYLPVCGRMTSPSHYEIAPVFTPELFIWTVSNRMGWDFTVAKEEKNSHELKIHIILPRNKFCFKRHSPPKLMISMGDETATQQAPRRWLRRTWANILSASFYMDFFWILCHKIWIIMKLFRLRQALLCVKGKVWISHYPTELHARNTDFHVLNCAWLIEVRPWAWKKMSKIGLHILFPAH